MEFEVPKELMDRQLLLVKKARESGKIKIGVNEVTKTVERDKAKLVLIAQDVSPKEIVMHLPLLCREKKIPYTFVTTKKELGEKAGIEVGAATVAIVEEGKDGKKELMDIAKKLASLGGVPLIEEKLKESEEKAKAAQREMKKEAEQEKEVINESAKEKKEDTEKKAEEEK